MKKIIPIALLLTVLLSCNKKDQKDISYQVADETSKAEWKGSAPDHFHVGSFKVTGSLVTDANGKVKSGTFVIPIASIEDYDLQDPIKTVLLDDLKSANFFNMLVHPNAGFKITNVAPYTGNNTDTSLVADANYMVTGDFSMLDQTRSISFPAKIVTNSNGLQTEAKFKIDRTKWGMNIYSDPTQQLYILPDINIHLKIQATKAQ